MEQTDGSRHGGPPDLCISELVHQLLFVWGIAVLGWMVASYGLHLEVTVAGMVDRFTVLWMAILALRLLNHTRQLLQKIAAELEALHNEGARLTIPPVASQLLDSTYRADWR